MTNNRKVADSFFASDINVSSSGIISVDGKNVRLFGITPIKTGWHDRLRVLLKWRKIYVITEKISKDGILEVRLFCGRGDLSSYLIWEGYAYATNKAYFHVIIVMYLISNMRKLSVLTL